MDGGPFIPASSSIHSAAKNRMASDLSNALENDDVIIMDCDEVPAPIKTSKKKHSKCKRKKHTRAVTVNTVDNYTETLIITRKKEIKKQKKEYVMNLDQNISKHRTKVGIKHSKRIATEHQTRYFQERIVPACRCNHIKDYGRSRKKVLQRPEHRIRTNHHNSHKKHWRNSHTRKTTLSEGKHKPKKSIKEPSLSSLSISPSRNSPQESDISYEDVSLGSFSSYCESELDTLIKRTKKREVDMKLSSNFLSQEPLCASTPEPVIEIISEDIWSDLEEDTSIHSQATVLVDDLDDTTYSPTTAWRDYQEKYEETPENTIINMSSSNNYMIDVLSSQRGIKEESVDPENNHLFAVANNNVIPYSEKDLHIKEEQIFF